MRFCMFPNAIRNVACAAICACGLAVLAEPAQAVTITLWTNNIVMPENQTFQMPITASDPDGQPLKFGVTMSKKKKVTAVFAPSTNRSLLINVSGVDATNGAFTGDLVLQLFEDLTPLTTARIIDLVNSNFYNGLLFQRVIKGFVAQGGGATTNLNLKSGVALDDEYVKTLTYDGFGQLGMANQASSSGSSTHDSNDSQFFITDVDLSITNTNNKSPESLNFEQPIFGQLTSGFDVLAKIMSTPVGANPNSSSEISAPLSNVVMNSVSVISTSQNTVLRLTATRKFHGMVTVTVTATNAENQVASQAFQVNVVTNSIVSPPFMGPIPASVTVTQATAATFIATATDINANTRSNRPSFAFEDVDTGAFPTNMLIGRNKRTSRFWFSPDMTLTGTVHMLMGVTDGIHSYDTQHFTLNVLPRSATPTMTIVPLKGEIVDSTSTNSTNGSHISVSGTFAFNSQSDQTFSSNDVIELNLGDPSNPFSVSVTPDLHGWKLKNGSIRGKARLATATSSNVTASAQFNIAKNTFAISVRKFDFPSPGLTNNEIQIGVSIGANYGTDLRPWVQIKPGVFVPPAPLVTGSQ
jgi:cyclophilin family peptidyl-prolyl cis-trans isomerase